MQKGGKGSSYQCERSHIFFLIWAVSPRFIFHNCSSTFSSFLFNSVVCGGLYAKQGVYLIIESKNLAIQFKILWNSTMFQCRWKLYNIFYSSQVKKKLEIYSKTGIRIVPWATEGLTPRDLRKLGNIRKISNFFYY